MRVCFHTDGRPSIRGVGGLIVCGRGDSVPPAQICRVGGGGGEPSHIHQPLCMGLGARHIPTCKNLSVYVCMWHLGPRPGGGERRVGGGGGGGEGCVGRTNRVPPAQICSEWRASPDSIDTSLWARVGLGAGYIPACKNLWRSPIALQVVIDCYEAGIICMHPSHAWRSALQRECLHLGELCTPWTGHRHIAECCQHS